NVLLHAAVCVLLAVVLGEITHRPRLAGTAAFLLAAHPVHTEAVASVVGRAEELAALAGLGAWWLVLRARRHARGRSAWLAGAARRLVWPLGLSADYSYRQVELATGLGEPGALAGLGIVVGTAALAAWGWRRERPVCLALALAALPYSIVSNVFVTIGTVMA